MKLPQPQFAAPLNLFLSCWILFLLASLPTSVHSFGSSHAGVTHPVRNVNDPQPLFPVQAGDIWLEAEEADAIGSFWSLENNSDASGGSYLRVNTQLSGEQDNTPDDPMRQIVFTFEVAQAGTYQLYVRHKSLNGNDDSFYLQVNNNERSIWDTQHWTGFYWERASQTYSLTAGTNTIRLASREKNFRVDRLYLTQSGDYPYGKGDEDPDPAPVSQWLEAETAVPGSSWTVQNDPEASGGQYAVNPGARNTDSPSTNPADQLTYSFSVPQQGDYFLFTRINAPDGGANSLWLKIDNQPWIGWTADIFTGIGFAWNLPPNSPLSLEAGSHTIKVTYREGDTQLDKFYLSNNSDLPIGKGNPSPPPPTGDATLLAGYYFDSNSLEATLTTRGSWGALTGRNLESFITNDIGAPTDPIVSMRTSSKSTSSAFANGRYAGITFSDITRIDSLVFYAARGGSSNDRELVIRLIDEQGDATTILSETKPATVKPTLTKYTVAVDEAVASGEIRIYPVVEGGSGRSIIVDGIEVYGAAAAAPAVEIIIDNADPGFSTTGSWPVSSQQENNRYGPNYVHDGNTGKGSKTATFSASVAPGTYEVYGWWSASSNRATNVPYDIVDACGTNTVLVNQRTNGASWQLLGTYVFEQTAQVTLRTDGTDAYVIADAIKLVPSSATVEPCSEEPYTPPTPPSIVNNPPDGTTAPSVSGIRPTSQSNSNVNYVRVFTPREQYNQPSQVTLSQSVADVSVSTEYLDGLGRPIQTVVRGGSGSAGQDLVQPVEYDQFGRQTKQYLPYAASGASGAYRPNGLQAQYDFYTDGPGNVAQSGYPYAETKFEASPLNRPVEQAAPGENWRLGSGHEVTTDYLVNASGEVRQWTAGNLSGTSLSTAKNYDAGTLYKTVVTDENGHTTTEFRDKLNMVVLKRVQGPDGNQDTYYVYDDYNLLRFVLPPEASRQLVGNTSLTSNADFRQKYLFVYQYDNRRRMSSKQVPGGGTTTMKYDPWDRLALSQSALQASRGEWSFTKYDQLNRPIITGVTTSAAVSGSRFETKNGSTVGYTLSGSPHSVSAAQVRTVTYYDDYSFPHAGGSYAFSDNLAARNYRPDARGQVTGTRTRNLSDNSWLNSVTYYDEQYRPIQAVSDNHLGGKDRVTTTYRNAVNSEITASKRVHSSNSGPTRTITQNYSYDHTGRLTQVTHQWDGQAAVTLSAQQYNAIGELVEKDLGNDQQSVDYRYNIRGWLTRINDLGSSERYFNQELYYDFGFDKKQHNGNISGIRWNRAGGKAHAYGYLYDEVNRITGADYRAKPLSGSWASSPGNFTVDKVAYDQNGNITDLKRYGEQDERQYLWDNLEYKYDGNRLRAVGELPEGQADVGFVDGVAGSATQEYNYDAAGNMTADANKGISSIVYDPVLNLPTDVVINGKGTIKYTYDASGTKLRQEVLPSDGSPTKTTDYVGGFHYSNGTLDFVQHEEGRLMIKDGLAYHYDLKDHLGNARVTFSNVPVTTTNTASMEASAAPVEEAVFEGVAESRQTLAFHNTTTASSSEPQPNKVATLQPGQQGPAKSVAVHAGDTVRIKVNARYETVPSRVQGMEGVATEIAGMVQRGAAGLESSGAITGSNGLAAGSALTTGKEQEVPQAYLNYLLYDENYQLVDQGFQQVSEAAAVGKANPNADAEELALEVPITEEGFLYTYLSNEPGASASSSLVYFDDFTVEQQSYIVQVDDYYPFGLRMSGRSYVGTANRYLFNGKELQEETGWYDFGARMYDPGLGRWMTPDPLSDEFPSHSVYNYALNNPIRFIDPDGQAPMDPNCPGCPTNDEFANALATDVLSVKHSLYNMLARPFGYEATFTQNEAGNYETGFVKTNDDFLTAAGKYALDALSVGTFGRGGGPNAFLAKTPGKSALSNQAKNLFDKAQDAGDFVSEHAFKRHKFDPSKASSRSRTQYGENINAQGIRQQTIQSADDIVRHVNEGGTHYATTYKKRFDSNVSTADTPTRESRVIINHLNPEKSTQFPYYKKGVTDDF